MILLGKVGMAIAGTVLAGAGIICSEGMISVNVETRSPEKHHVFVVAPAMLVPIAMHFIPKEHLADHTQEIQPWLPTIRASLDAVSEADDITFVEVNEPGQKVRVAKSGGSIVVDLNDNDETVHVSTPIRAMSSAIEELAAASPALTR
ncbi:MAG TPA: hypothetical protein VKB40_02310 [Candidatus Acidoferrales bacterium]|nr:hypothetical protein [Candidatus Acidoferrales bacterium]